MYNFSKHRKLLMQLRMDSKRSNKKNKSLNRKQ